jgi:hypothetical protein
LVASWNALLSSAVRTAAEAVKKGAAYWPASDNMLAGLFEFDLQ